ncbi:MAG: hypothetical protein KA956_07500 [Pyrinomonadaceae bacterium]|nr:hypothetical protein [Acidobacteriota bacterium]MBP7376306.1 hypothetical protein [Pyrinomonadaceae bacterium]
MGSMAIIGIRTYVFFLEPSFFGVTGLGVTAIGEGFGGFAPIGTIQNSREGICLIPPSIVFKRLASKLRISTKYLMYRLFTAFASPAGLFGPRYEMMYPSAFGSLFKTMTKLSSLAHSNSSLTEPKSSILTATTDGLTDAVALAVLAQAAGNPPISSVAVTDLPARSAVSTVITELPCPLLIVPAEIDQLNDRVIADLESPLTIFALKVTDSPAITSSLGAEMLRAGHWAAAPVVKSAVEHKQKNIDLNTYLIKIGSRLTFES